LNKSKGIYITSDKGERLPLIDIHTRAILDREMLAKPSKNKLKKVRIKEKVEKNVR